jgi:hypothetical protein
LKHLVGSVRSALKGTTNPDTQRLAMKSRCRARRTESFENAVRGADKGHNHHA